MNNVRRPSQSPSVARRLERLNRAARLEEAYGLEIEPGVFLLRNPTEIASSLQRMAERKQARGGRSAFETAMSGLLRYIARIRRRLTRPRRAKLEAVKVELRGLYKDSPRQVRG